MIKIGLVGAGGMGTVHRTSFSYMEGAEVAAVVGTSVQDAERARGWNLPMFRSISDMLVSIDVDIVDICTPTYLHADGIEEAASYGRSVITEKPIALSLKEAQTAYEAADRAGVRIYVAQVLQFYRQSEVLHGLVKSGEYGNPLDAYFTRLSACPKWARDGWLFDEKKSGLVPYDLHIHDLDLIVSLFGRPKDFSFTSCGSPGRKYREHYRFNYAYDGFNASAEAGWLNADIPFTAEWRVYFENALVINRDGAVTAYRFGETPRIFDTDEKIKIPTGINVPPTGTYLSELKHFLECWKKNEPSPRVPGEQVLTVMELLENMR
ncbi:MAG: Gfo/Idh/MocA family oxidoreductase [Synergistaceae bacterium]|jgi:predicted dehydrogenase|nr:Gfo/Idh/MocA family oxidoreductase [Synergistaceae bacterium]